MRHRRLSRALLSLAAVLSLTSTASAIFLGPTHMPVGRVVANLQKYTQEHPDDPRGHYTLARAHALAFTLKTHSLAVFPWGSGPKLTISNDADQHAVPGVPTQAPPDHAELTAHVNAAIRGFERSLTLDPKAPETQIGYAYLLDTAADFATDADKLPAWCGPVSKSPVPDTEIDRRIDDLGSPDQATRDQARKALQRDLIDVAPRLHDRRADQHPARRDAIAELLREYWKRCAVERYFFAFKRSIDKDAANKFRPMSGLKSFISYESALAIIRLADDGVAADAERIQTVKTALAKLEKLPDSGAVTPIIFDLTAARPLTDLIDPAAAVAFDLDGTGRPQRWPWVRPGASILVWDPDGAGSITSGRQLFGSVTWWMFFTDGYHALDALDDDRDGRLRAAELRGLAAWRDFNGNGLSEPGEVTPLDRLGVVGLCVRATDRTGDSPMNIRGLELDDGRVLPTYDWIATPATALTDAPTARRESAQQP